MQESFFVLGRAKIAGAGDLDGDGARKLGIARPVDRAKRTAADDALDLELADRARQDQRAWRSSRLGIDRK